MEYMYFNVMILGIIIFTASVLGLGYAMYNSTVQNKKDSAQELEHDWDMDEQQLNDPYPRELTEEEKEVIKLLNELEEHIHAYKQYYEQKVWECHNCIQLTEQCMALQAGSEERLALYQIMKRDVTEFNKYMHAMKSHSQYELEQGWNIAVHLHDMHLVNPEHIALFHECWKEIVPYVISEKYTHDTLESSLEYRTQLIELLKSSVIQRKQQYAETHKEMLQWEYKYEHIKAETMMANAELETAKLDMEAADHALAMLLAQNQNENYMEQDLVNAYYEAAEQALILKEAEANVARVDKARLELETANLDVQEDTLEQILREHQQPGEELHPSFPPGARIVPGNDAHFPPPSGGGWWSEFIEWIISWFG